MIYNRFCFVAFASVIFAIVLVSFVPRDANAQIPGVTVKPLLQTTLSGDDTKELRISSVQFAPGSKLRPHTHPGDDCTIVIQGVLELNVKGHEPRRVSAGEAFHIPRGVVHYTRVLGDTPARTIAVFVIEKGKPVVQPVTK